MAHSYNNLAQLLQAQNKLDEAELMFRRALAILKNALGEDHPDVATARGELGYLLDAKARQLDEAGASDPAALARIYTEAADMQTFAYGAEDEDVLRIRRRLAELTVVIREKALGEDHPDVATSLNNLAGLLEAQGKLDEAEPMYRRALAIDEKALGEDHPDVATSLNNLAYLLQSQHKLDEAEPMHRRALAIKEKALGEDHPEVATLLNNLANLLESQHKLDEAEPMHRRALAIREKALGEDHPEVAASPNSFANVLQSQLKLDEAEPMPRRRIDINDPNICT